MLKKWPGVFDRINTRIEKKLPDDFRMDVGIVDVIERHLRLQGRWDSLVEGVLRATLKPGDVFVDVGSNIGYFGLMAAKLVGDSGTVVCFEPSTRALARLAHHVFVNDLHNVLVVSAACGDVVSLSRINYSSDSNSGASAINRTEYSIGRQELIHVCRIDDQCQALGLRPTLIKIDVEGFELHVIRGAVEILKTVQPLVVLELTDSFLRQNGGSASKLLGMMISLNYRPYRLAESGGRICATPMVESYNCEDLQIEVLFAVEKLPDDIVVEASRKS